jgi:hypothetical protein
MAFGFFDPQPDPFHPTRTTNRRDVFAPPAHDIFNPARPMPDVTDEETDELAQFRALLDAGKSTSSKKDVK